MTPVSIDLTSYTKEIALRIKDIAQIAGVSPSTVSKIMNGKDDSISQETRTKVLDVVREYHYAPYSWRTQPSKSWTIGVLLRSSVSLDSTLDGIIEVAQDRGYGTLVFNSYSDSEREIKNITALTQKNVDGIIWEPVSIESLNQRAFFERDTPVLTMGPNGGDASLLLPYEEAAYKLTQELIDHHHREIGCLMTNGRRTKDFLSGFRKCLFDNNLPFEENNVFYDLDDVLINKISRQALTGFVSSHYATAVKFYQLMTSLNYRIPIDASLVSVRNDTTHIRPIPNDIEISTYSMRNADFGAHLCSKIINEIENNREDVKSFVHEFHLDNTKTLDFPEASQRKKIVIIGNITFDTYISLSRLPGPNEKVNASAASSQPGGSGVFFSIAASNLGHRVSLIGNVGADSESDYIYSELSRRGINTMGILRRSDTNTGTSQILVDGNGNSTVTIIAGANATLSGEDVEKRNDVFEDADYCLIGANVSNEAIIKACILARAVGARTALSYNEDTSVPQELQPLLDILILNDCNPMAVGQSDMSISDTMLNAYKNGVGTVIVLRADKTCLFVSDESDGIIEDSQTVIPTGFNTPDAFAGTLISYLLYGYRLHDAIQIAGYAANYFHSRDQGLNSLIDRYTIDHHFDRIAGGIDRV